jgi:two-component system LytT family response regulator
VFLDIRMPGMDGFEVLEHVERVPRIIFTTAYGDYALRAFEDNAVDYLLKPYDKKRFARAILKAINRRGTYGDEIGRIVRVVQQSREPENYPQRIFVRVGRKIIAVQLDDIVWIEADGDYTKLHTHVGTHLCNLSLNALEVKLDSSKFMRVHRSTIIATNSIEYLRRDGEGGFVAMLTDKAKLRVSRTYAAKLRKNIW